MKPGSPIVVPFPDTDETGFIVQCGQGFSLCSCLPVSEKSWLLGNLNERFPE